jgi:membrane-associated phospholipid phosphatase
MLISRRHWMIAALLLACFVFALFFDARVAAFIHNHGYGPRVRASKIATFVKWPGDFRFTLALSLIILSLGFVRGVHHWRSIATLLLGGILAGLFYTVIKWVVGRTRPFPRNALPVPPFELHPFRLGIAGLWKADNQAFPSGHASLAFATAAAMCMIFPRACALCILWAMLVGVERVLEGAHYPSDAVAGAIVGILSTVLAKWIIGRSFSDAPLPIDQKP